MTAGSSHMHVRKEMSQGVCSSVRVSDATTTNKNIHAILYTVMVTINIFYILICIIKVEHLSTCVLSLCQYQGVIRWKYASYLTDYHWLITTLGCLCRFRQGRRGSDGRGGVESHWWIICLFTSEWQWGLNQEVAVMFFHKRGLSGGASGRRTTVPALCPVELSPCPQPEAWQRVRGCHHFYLTHGRKLSLMTSNFLTFQLA